MANRSDERRPFGRGARPPRIRALAFPCTTAGSTPPPFGHESFAVICPLALVGVACYPVSVRRPAGSFPASFSAGLATVALRFPWVLVTKFPEDFHLLVSAHAGRTENETEGPRG